MYAVILAGGGGTRLWPLSRGRSPKPFLPLLEDGRSLLEATVARLAPLIELGDIHVVTEARYGSLVRRAVPGLPARNLIAEPLGRNTAPALALAVHLIDRPRAEVMVSLHADQTVADETGWRAALAAAAERAAGGDIVTVGIQPTEPATGYGYVLAEGAPALHAGLPTYRVERFEEKPSPARARELIRGGRAYWNAGSFVWRRDTLLDGLARHAPDIDAPIAAWAAPRLGRAEGVRPPDGDEEELARDLLEVYTGLPARAIDYALLEPASLEGRVAVVPAAVGWSDLGTWSALRMHRAGQGSQPVTAEPPATVVSIDSRDVFVHATGGRVVALVGVADLIVIDTPDALLISSADAAQEVKRVVDELRGHGREDLL